MRCSYRHEDFSFTQEKGFQCDGTGECWVTDVGNFNSNDTPVYYCIFHAPLNQEPRDRDDWVINSRGKMQAEQLKLFLNQWRKTNEDSKPNKQVRFILPGMQCGEIHLHNYKFENSVRFTSAIFTGNAWFGGAEFKKDADFSNVTFKQIASFHSTIFSGNTRFNSATFESITAFKETIFSGEVRFISTIFDSNVSYEKAEFDVEK